MRLLLAVLTCWLWFPLGVVGFLLASVGLDTIASYMVGAAFWLANIPIIAE